MVCLNDILPILVLVNINTLFQRTYILTTYYTALTNEIPSANDHDDDATPAACTGS